MKPFVVIFIPLVLFMSQSVFSGSMETLDDAEPCWGPTEACSSPSRPIHTTHNRFLSFSIGPAWSNNGQTQTVNVQPGVVNTYKATLRHNVFPYGEVGFGMEKQLNQILYTQLGIEVGGGGAARFRGTIVGVSNPSTPIETYSYNVNEGRVLVKGKLLADLHFYDTRPFVTGGVGVSFNHAYAFSVVKPASAPPTPAAPLFKSNMQTTLATTVGLGLEEVINENWHAAIGYEFANWGENQLAPATGQPTKQGLVVNNVYINSVLLSLIYLC